jgi:CrcB protein
MDQGKSKNIALNCPMLIFNIFAKESATLAGKRIMTNLILIFLGGGAGSVARYGLMNLISRSMPGSSFPWHTLGVNVLGAFAIGILIEVLALRISMPQPERFLLVTGFLGGFTTFSAFSMETALLLERGDYVNMAAYIVASVVVTVAAVFIGIGIVRSLS